MKITVESTTRIVTVNGFPGRVWEGKTESGIEVIVLITRIAAPAAADLSEFDRELRECKPPTDQATRVFPSPMFLNPNKNGQH